MITVSDRVEYLTGSPPSSRHDLVTATISLEILAKEVIHNWEDMLEKDREAIILWGLDRTHLRPPLCERLICGWLILRCGNGVVFEYYQGIHRMLDALDYWSAPVSR